MIHQSDFLNAHYDKDGKLVFEGGDPIMFNNEEGVSRPSLDEVKARLGEDTAELYSRSIEREFTEDDRVFSEFSKENNDALKSLNNWDDNLEGSAEYFSNEVELYFKEE